MFNVTSIPSSETQGRIVGRRGNWGGRIKRRRRGREVGRKRVVFLPSPFSPTPSPPSSGVVFPLAPVSPLPHDPPLEYPRMPSPKSCTFSLSLSDCSLFCSRCSSSFFFSSAFCTWKSTILLDTEFNSIQMLMRSCFSGHDSHTGNSSKKKSCVCVGGEAFAFKHKRKATAVAAL